MRIRGARMEDLEEVLNLLDSCFRTERAYFERFVPDKTSFPELALVAEEDDRIVGFLQVYPRKVRSRRGVLYVGGIGNVAVDRNYRNRGIGSKLLEKATDLMLERGFDFSLLFASRYRFYRRAGWFPIPRPVYEFEVGKGDSGIDVVSVTPENLRELEDLHEGFNRGFPLTVVRNGYLWELHFGYGKRTGKAVFSSHHGRPIAYVIYVDEGDRKVIEDCAFVSEDAFIKLVGLLGPRVVLAGHKTHPAIRALEAAFGIAKVGLDCETFVKPLRTDRGDLLNALGIGGHLFRWHYWGLDKF